MMARRLVAAIGAAVVVRHAEVTEETVERAVLRDIRHTRDPVRVFVINRVGVAELDLDGNDGGLHAVDDVSEGGWACRGLSGRGASLRGRDRCFDRDPAKGGQRYGA